MLSAYDIAPGSIIAFNPANVKLYRTITKHGRQHNGHLCSAVSGGGAQIATANYV